MKRAGDPPTLQNISRAEIPINKVTARGRRYAYVRGTDISLVKGFVGTPAQFDEAIGEAIRTLDIVGPRALKGLLPGHRFESARILHRMTKSRAGHKKRPYTLSVEFIHERLKSAKDRCEITGIVFDYGPKQNDQWLRRPMAPSLDRISNAGGYTPDNIRLVCGCVNVAINEWGLDNFDQICRAYVATHPSQTLAGKMNYQIGRLERLSREV